MTAPKTDSVHSVSPSGEAVRAALPALDHPDYWRLMYERREQEAHELSEQIIALRASHDALLDAPKELLALPGAIQELRYLDNGIGTATPAAAWLRARTAVRAAPLSSADLALAESFAGPKFPMKEGGGS